MEVAGSLVRSWGGSGRFVFDLGCRYILGYLYAMCIGGGSMMELEGISHLTWVSGYPLRN